MTSETVNAGDQERDLTTRFRLSDRVTMMRRLTVVKWHQSLVCGLYPHLIVQELTLHTPESLITLVTDSINRFADGDKDKVRLVIRHVPKLIDALVHDEVALQNTLCVWYRVLATTHMCLDAR